MDGGYNQASSSTEPVRLPNQNQNQNHSNGRRNNSNTKGRRGMGLLKSFYDVEGSRELAEKKIKLEKERKMRDLFEKPGFSPVDYAQEMLKSTNKDDVVAHKESIDGMAMALETEGAKVTEECFAKIVGAARVAAEVSHAFGQGMGDDRNQLSRILNYIGGSALRLSDELGPTSEKLMDKLERKAAADAFLRLKSVNSVVERCVAESRYLDAVKAYRRGCQLTKACGGTPVPPDGCLDVLWHRFRQDKFWESSVALAKILTEFGADRQEIVSRYIENAKKKAAEVSDDVYQFEPTANDFENSYRAVCTRIVSELVPFLIGIINNCQNFDRSHSNDVLKEKVVFDFVSIQITSLCNRFLTDVFLKTPYPPPSVQTLVSGVLRVRDALRPLHALFPKLLSRIFMRFLHEIAKTSASFVFESATTGFLETVLEMHTKLSRDEEEVDFTKLVEQIEHNGLFVLSASLTDCEPLLGLLANDKNGKNTFMETVYKYVASFFKKFLCAVMAFTNVNTQIVVSDQTIDKFANLGWNNLFSLSLGRISLYFQSTGIQKLVDVTRDLLPDSGVNFPIQAVNKYCDESASNSIKYYVEVVGSKFVGLLQNHLASRNWLVDQEPREASVVISLLIKELQMVQSEVAHFVPSAQKKITTRNNNRRSPVTEMERIFARKKQILTNVAPTTSGLMTGILLVALKGLVDGVRKEFFGQAGVLQIRLDIGMLQNEIVQFVDDTHVFDGLFDEILTSAQRRCVATASAGSDLSRFSRQQ